MSSEFFDAEKFKGKTFKIDGCNYTVTGVEFVSNNGIKFIVNETKSRQIGDNSYHSESVGGSYELTFHDQFGCTYTAPNGSYRYGWTKDHVGDAYRDMAAQAIKPEPNEPESMYKERVRKWTIAASNAVGMARTQTEAKYGTASEMEDEGM